MPVGLPEQTALLPIAGVRLSSVAAGIRYKDRTDLLLIELAEGSETAGTFTQNRFCAAPVEISRKHLGQTSPRYWLINSGNANAGTGSAGYAAAVSSCEAVASEFGVDTEQVLPFSTGVIGEQLVVSRIESAMPALGTGLKADGWNDAANAIMTTDTVPKGISEVVEIDGKAVTITGIVKGAGMIMPNMATMLSFIATDARIEASVLQSMVSDLVNRTFNCVTIDGDTSTNDACMLAATGVSGVSISAKGEQAAFDEALEAVFGWLSQSLVRDGEGATKFVEIRVSGAESDEDARAVAYTVAHSPLVKTALYASDPNWGRILAAVGRAPINSLDIASVDLFIGDVCLIRGGEPDPGYSEAQGQAVFAKEEILISISLGSSAGSATVWTSDLSPEYVSINADYRS